MTLRQLATGLFSAALAAALLAPASADQVFWNYSTGSVKPLPTPTGVPVYDYYGSPCIWSGNGTWPNHGGRWGGHWTTGTINGERFYPYDPRSTSNTSRAGHWGSCFYASEPGHRPVPPPRRIPLAKPTPRS